MKPFIIIIAIALAAPSPALSQQPARQDTATTTPQSGQKEKKTRKVRLHGQVNDSFTNASLPALVTVMDTDSSLVDSMTCWNWRLESGYSLSVPAVNGRKFIIKAEYDGYEPTCIDYVLKYANRKNYFEVPDIKMKRAIHESIDLEGVVVTGTKVKFTYHGDTLVYNASAFNLPEGSMLDGLIKQMPGAELKSNGDIYINGRKVDYLTLNGKDFFKGNNKMMLENLPYYTVNNIKVFDKSSEKSEVAGHEVEKKDYVMDVNLKREYAKGYIVNGEAGAGTHDRYQGRLFGLRYTDHSRLSVMGNVNNVNDVSQPGSEGEWWDRSIGSGQVSMKRVGINADMENKAKTVKDNLSADVTWTDNDTRTRTSSLAFAEAGDINSYSLSASRSKNKALNVYNRFTLTKPFRLYANLGLYYSSARNTSESSDSTWRDALINRSWTPAFSHSRSFSTNLNGGFYQSLPWGDTFSIHYTAGFNRHKPVDSYSIAETFYAANDSTDFRHRYGDTRNHGYNYVVDTQYEIQLPLGWTAAPGFYYAQRYSDDRNYSYRLDWLNRMADRQGARAGGMASPLATDLTWLPSTRDSLQLAMDIANSNHYNMLTRTHQYYLSVRQNGDHSWMQLTLPLNRISERLNYQNAAVDTLARRSYWDFSPSFFANGWSEKVNYFVSYSYSNTHPDLVSLMPNTNTASALATTINNPRLKTTQEHSAELWLNFSKKPIEQQMSLTANATYTRRAVGTRTTYNTATGHYTYMQDNVDKPNYSIDGRFEWARSLDSLGMKHFSVQTRTSASHTHSVDFDIAYDNASDVLSKVNNLTLGQYLKLAYQKDKLTLEAFAEFSYRHATGNLDNFQKVNTRDFRYGLTGEYEFPFKLQVATDLTEFDRGGYQTRDMNRNYLVWNAQIAYPFLKGKLTAKVRAYDILGQISSTSYNINAQGRTETWTNSLSRYVMFSLAWKFAKSPKK